MKPFVVPVTFLRAKVKEIVQPTMKSLSLFTHYTNLPNTNEDIFY